MSWRPAPPNPANLMSEDQDALLIKKRARRRLIGAVALVLFVVIVLPMVLDKEPKPLQNELSVQIPRQDSGVFKTRVLPQMAVPEGDTAKAEAATPNPPTVAAPVAGTRIPAKEPERAAQKPGQTAQPDPASSPEPGKTAAVKPSPAIASGVETERAQSALNDAAWVVPLGVFANPDNARQLQAKLEAAGVKSLSEALKAPDGEKIRVRAEIGRAHV